MTIRSMTGFARSDGLRGPVSWHWELRSVNNRGLDIRLRLPPGYEALEPRVRDALTRRLTRGSVSVSLTVSRETGQMPSVRLNEAAFNQILAAVERVRSAVGGPAPRAEWLLALKGVLEVTEEAESEEQIAARQDAIFESFEAALESLAQARAAEGQRLAAVLATQVAEVARLSREIEVAPGRAPEAIRRRIAEQVARIVDMGHGLDPARLHQEAVLVATRADVEEELKRLAAHVEAARALLSEPGAVGRKLDFLAQEFNREANTLTSKAGDAEISRLGLALKVVIDQMREQVQNIE